MKKPQFLPSFQTLPSIFTGVWASWKEPVDALEEGGDRFGEGWLAREDELDKTQLSVREAGWYTYQVLPSISQSYVAPQPHIKHTNVSRISKPTNQPPKKSFERTEERDFE